MKKITIKRILTVISLLLYLNSSLIAQSNNKSISTDSLARQRDIVDLFHITSKHISLTDSIKKQKGFGPFYSFMPAVGYTMLSGLTGTFVANMTFDTDTTRSRFSSILLNSNYSQFNQYWFILNTNIFFEKYKLHLVGDDRYYKFPTHTYGFGLRNKPSDALNIDYSYLRIYQIIYREITPNFFVGVGYNLDYHWRIKTDSLPSKTFDQFWKNTNAKHSVSSSPSFNMMYDSRKNPENPQGGSYALLQYRPNLMLLGSNNNWQSLLIDLRHYIPFPASTRNVICFWNYEKLTLAGTAPYLDMPSIGWDEYSNTGRGYVPGRFTGRNLAYFETEYRMVLTNNGLLGCVVFANAETVFQDVDKLRGTYIPGGGLGLRIKVNKRSNTNIAVDYGFGIDGSHGFIFNLGEVF
jgi:hypothetical protein